MGVEVAAGAAIIGGVTSVIGQQRAAKAQQKAAKVQADSKRRQAAELLRRTDVNLEQLAQDTDDFVADQALAFAAAGVDVGSGVSLLAAEETKRKAIEERLFRLEEARFQAQELEIGADDDIRVGNDFREAGNISSIGTVINTVASIPGVGK